MLKIASIAAAFTALGFTTAALAEVAAADRKFIESAAMAGLAEVELGKVATARGSSQLARDFGQRMVNEHRRLNVELKRLASAKGIELPATLDAKHKKDVDELRAKDAKRFDRDYIDMMVKDHTRDLAEFRKQSKAAKDKDVRAFAVNTWPMMNVHLEIATALKKWLSPAKAK